MENDENDEKTATNKDMSAGLAEIPGNHGNDENHMNPGCKPQVPKQLV